MSSPESFRAAWSRQPLLGQANLLAFAVLTMVLSLILGPAWLHNPDLSHGLLMPAAFFFLIWESRATGSPRYLSGKTGMGLAVAALAGGGVAVLSLAGLYAAVLDWSHALVEFLLTTAVVLFLGAGLVRAADARARLIPFNWPSVAAVGLWLLSAPIPPGTYTRLTIALQLWVSVAVLHSLHLLGIAALRNGNIIELARTSVGVEEACSGVRSLVSCLFTGLFLSATMVRRPRSRALLIVLAGPLALAMNFGRSLTLTLLANAGVTIAGFWHDATGFVVLGATALILAALALGLAKRERRPLVVTTSPIVPSADIEPPLRPLGLACALGLAAVIALFFYHNTRQAPTRSARAPDLWSLIPASPPGWSVSSAQNLAQFSGILRTRALAQRLYRQPLTSQGQELTLYLAYWAPGQAPVSLVASHTPDTCWPGSGWVLRAPPAPESRFVVAGHVLALPEAEYFENSGFPQYVWFWHLYAGRPIPYENPYSVQRLLSIAWRYGFQHDGEQLFVRVSSNRPWSQISQDPLIEEFFAGLRGYGL